MGDLYLGLDLSTQSLKSVLIDDQLNLVHSDVVVLDELGWEFLWTDSENAKSLGLAQKMVSSMMAPQ